MNNLATHQPFIPTIESQFRLLIEEAPAAICLFVGKEMRIEIANAIMIGYWGKGASILGKPLAEALPELNGQGFLEILDRVYTTGETHAVKAAPAVLEVNGVLGTYYFDYTYKAIRNEHGEIYGVMDFALDVTPQIVTSNQLNESRENLDLAIEIGGLGTYTIDLKTDICTYSQSITMWFGFPQYGATLSEVFTRIHPEDYDYFAQHIQAAVDKTNNGKYDLIYRIINPETQREYYLHSIGQVQYANNEAVFMSGIIQDVTEQIISRKKIEDSELFARSIIEHSPVGKIVLIGADMRIETINTSMLELLGRDRSIMGKTFLHAIPEMASSPTLERMKHVYETGEIFYQPEEKLEFIRYEQPYTGYFSYVYKALKNTAGKIYGIMVTAMDITEQVVNRKKIEETEVSLRNAIELADLGTWDINLRTGILDYSERLRDWFSIEKDEIISIERAYKPIIETERHKVKAAIMHAITPGTNNVYDVEYSVKADSGKRERIIHAMGKAFFDENGQAYKISGTAIDITEQRNIQLSLMQQVQERTEELMASNEELMEANERLVLSNEELSQYAYVASHDLQEPLRKIRVFSDLLSTKTGIPEESKYLIEKINKSSERMSLLIKDLLNFSRLIKSDNMTRPVDLNELLEAILTDFELTIAEKKAFVHIHPLPVIDGVALQMNQVFYNLISNALKFTRTGVNVEITVSAKQLTNTEVYDHILQPKTDKTYYDISIADNGIGFDVKYAEQIFEVFKRLHGKDVYPGSGIGLALCKRIIKKHHGHLYATSIQGEGSTFHIILSN